MTRIKQNEKLKLYWNSSMENNNKIPIKNVYYMLCYAWNLFNYANKKIFGNEAFENIHNLLAKLLVEEVKKLIKRGFHHYYIEETTATSRLRGMVNFSNSFTQMTYIKKQMICTYDEYSNNVLFNQILKSTLLNMLNYPGLNLDLKKSIRKIIPSFNAVKTIAINNRDFSLLKFNRNNLNYQMIMHICKLYYLDLIASKADRGLEFPNFDGEQMPRIYESFLLNFYKIHLNSSEYSVSANNIKWNLDTNQAKEWADLFEIEENPGNRRTDIVIQNNEKQIQLILDAKYYENMLVPGYRSENRSTYIQSHLNQIRGYILDSRFSGSKYGALLYPSVNYDPRYEKGKFISIKGAPVIVKAVNLNSEWSQIEGDLLNFVEKVFNKR